DASLEEQQGKCSNQRDDTDNEDAKSVKMLQKLIKLLPELLMTKTTQLRLYHATSLHDENVHACVYDSEETFDDAEKSRLKMQEIQKDENF
ncbi:hypothetical protein Tco_0885805, partial [Tanacetum coccineum]